MPHIVLHYTLQQSLQQSLQHDQNRFQVHQVLWPAIYAHCRCEQSKHGKINIVDNGCCSTGSDTRGFVVSQELDLQNLYNEPHGISIKEILEVQLAAFSFRHVMLLTKVRQCQQRSIKAFKHTTRVVCWIFCVHINLRCHGTSIRSTSTLQSILPSIDHQFFCPSYLFLARFRLQIMISSPNYHQSLG